MGKKPRYVRSLYVKFAHLSSLLGKAVHLSAWVLDRNRYLLQAPATSHGFWTIALLDSVSLARLSWGSLNGDESLKHLLDQTDGYGIRLDCIQPSTNSTKCEREPTPARTYQRV